MFNMFNTLKQNSLMVCAQNQVANQSTSEIRLPEFCSEFSAAAANGYDRQTILTEGTWHKPELRF